MDATLFEAAHQLEARLSQAKKEIDSRHVKHYKQHREAYINLFNPARKPINDQAIHLLANLHRVIGDSRYQLRPVEKCCHETTRILS